MVQLMMARYTPPETLRECDVTDWSAEASMYDLDRVAENGDMEAVLWMTHPPLLYDYNTTFERACGKGKLLIAQLLIDYVKVRPVDRNGIEWVFEETNPLNDGLVVAAFRGNEEIIELILKDSRTDTWLLHSADYNPFIQACEYNRISVVKMLLEDRMAHITHFLLTDCYETNDCFSYSLKCCYEYCVEKGYTEIVELLRNDPRVRYDPNATEPDYDPNAIEPGFLP